MTRAEGNRIIELDGQAAWSAYLDWLGLPWDASEGDSIPIGALAEALTPELAAEYGNPHILRVVTHHTEANEIVYATSCLEGTSSRSQCGTRSASSATDRMLTDLTSRRPGQVGTPAGCSDRASLHLSGPYPRPAGGGRGG